MLYCDCDNLPTATAAPKYRPDCAAAAPNVDAALAGPANTNVTPAAVTAAAVTDINAITGRRDRGFLPTLRPDVSSMSICLSGAGGSGVVPGGVAGGGG
ncbi:hypothetical protein GCM10027605_66690 [Micromonospora zhanjiangensis]